MKTIFVDIDGTLPPYYVPREAADGSLGGSTITEPYSELSDYLDKDDFSNLLGVLG